MKDRKHYVYGLYKRNVEYKTNKIDEHLFYVGITSVKYKPLESRARDHRKDRTVNKIKLNIIDKYDFEIKTLFICKTREEAEEREEFLIRWFGKICDKTGQLANVLDSAQDSPSNALTKEKIISTFCKRERSVEERTKLRDLNLTVPYNKVIEYLEEWAKNPLETQVEFCERKEISKSKFSHWIQLYRPEYLNLSNKTKEQAFLSAIEKFKQKEDIINFISEQLNIKKSNACSIFKRCSKRFNYEQNINKDNIKGLPKSEEYKVFWVYKFLNSGLCNYRFARENNINYSTLSKWTKHYTNSTPPKNNLPLFDLSSNYLWRPLLYKDKIISLEKTKCSD